MRDSRPPGGYACYVVGTLLIAWTLAYLDRQALTLLIPSLKADLSLSDVQVSLVQGLAFALFFAIAGLPIGRLVDRSNRRNILVAGLLVWSGMTIACGFATSFWELFIARMGVGIGEACLAPASYSLIADYFTAEKRGRAAGVMGAGGPLGNALSSMASGAIVHRFAASGAELPLIGHVEAWQLVFILFGLPGLFMALLLLTVREPERREVAVDLGMPALSFRQLVASERRLFLPLYAGLAFHFVCGYGIVAWGAVLLMRVHGMPAGEVGMMFGIMLLAGGTLASVIAGVASDLLVRRWPADGRLRFMWVVYPPLILTLVVFAFPAGAGFTFAVITIFTFLTGAFAAASYPILTDIVPNELRGEAIAVYMLVANLAGLGLTPTLVALVTDYVFGDEMMIRQSMVAVCLPASILVLVLLALAQRPYARLQERLAEARA